MICFAVAASAATQLMNPRAVSICAARRAFMLPRDNVLRGLVSAASMITETASGTSRQIASTRWLGVYNRGDNVAGILTRYGHCNRNARFIRE